MNKTFKFNETLITFTLDKENTLMVNATEMAKIFDKQVVAFMRNEETKNFIFAVLKSENSHFLGIKSEEDLCTSKQRSGTFMHRILAIKFAAWLDPDFEVWVYNTIDKILFGRHAEREASLKKTISVKNDMEKLEKKEEKSGQDFSDYLEKKRELRIEKNYRKSLTRECVNEITKQIDNQIKIDFEQEGAHDGK